MSPRVGSPTPAASAPVSRDVRQPGALEPGHEVGRRRVGDERAALVGIGGGEQPVERDGRERGVAVPRLAVGERELRALEHRVHELGAARAHRAEVEAVEQRELLQEHRPLPPRPGLVDGPALVGQALGRLEGRLERGEVVGREQAAMRATRAVRHLGPLAERADRLRDEAAIPRVARRLDLSVAIGRRRFGLVQDARVRRQRVPGGGRATTAPGAGSQVSADVGQSARNVDSSDAIDSRDARQDGMAVARVADRRLEHVAKRCRPELEQHPKPGVERTRHAGGEQTRSGDEVEPELAKTVGRRSRRRRDPARTRRARRRAQTSTG